MAKDAVKFRASLLAASVLAVGLVAFPAWWTPGGEDQPAPEDPKGHRPTAAFLDLDGSPLGGLLERRLLANPRAVWLERNAIEEIRREQKLEALMAAAAAGRRAAVARLLKADLLILLRTSSKPVKAAQLVVCESTHGLRLASYPLPLSGRTEDEAASLEAEVNRAIERHRQPIAEIVAVPPFVSQDLSYQYDHLQTAYAKLVEQALLDRPGLLVVELEEAQAIARELAAAGQTGQLRRPLPLYVLGEFRHRRDDSRTNVNVSVRLLRGESQMAERLAAGDPDQVPAFLRRAVQELIAETHGGQQKLPTAAEEARRLQQRSAAFQQIAQWEEAAGLLEAALLLDNGRELRRQAVIAYHNLTLEHWYRQTEGLRYYVRGLEQLEELLRTTGDVRKLEDEGTRHIVYAFPSLTIGLPLKGPAPKDGEDPWATLREREREILVRILRSRAQAGYEDDLRIFSAICRHHQLPKQEQFEIVYRFLVEFQDLPGLERRIRRYALRNQSPDMLACPEGEEFLARLEHSENPAFRAAAEKLRKEVADALALRQRFKEVAGPRPLPDSQPAKFTPMRFTALTPQGASRELSGFASCISAGSEREIAWDRHHLYAIRGQGPLRELWSNSERFTCVKQVVYDGRYAWAAVSRAYDRAFLLLVDPEKETVWQIDEGDGLPAESPQNITRSTTQWLAVSPLAPGRACAAGWFGRSWIALIEIHPTTVKPVKVDVIHEARQAEDMDQAERWKDPHLVFYPVYMLTLAEKPPADQGGQPRVLVGRSSSPEHPLVVEPQTRKVAVLQPGLAWGLTDQRPFEPSRIVAHQGAAYFLQAKQDPWRLHVYRLAPPDLTPAVFLADVPEGWLLFERDRLHIVGRQWRRVREDGRGVESLGEVPWYFRERFDLPGQPIPPESDYEMAGPKTVHLCELCYSRHYGLLGMVRTGGPTLFDDQWTAYRVTFDEAKEADPK